MSVQIKPFLISDLGEQENSVCLSVVVPTFNESENIRGLIVQLISVLDARLPNDYEIIVVDDNSPDQTWKIVQELLPPYPQVRLIRRDNEKGLASAVVRGWQMGRGKFLGAIDGDLQHPPDTILKFIEVMVKTQDVDLVVASRNIEGGGVSDWSIARRIISRGAQMLGLILMPSVVGRVSDPMSGYFIVRRAAIAGRTFKPLGYKILLEVMAKGNIQKIAEIGYVFQERKQGGSKVGLLVYWQYILHLLRLRVNSHH